MKLAQTLAGNWVITVANPEEDGWDTQLAEFSFDSVGKGSPAEVALRAATAAAFATLVKTLDRDNYSVESHSSDDANRMRAAVHLAFSAIGHQEKGKASTGESLGDILAESALNR